MLTQIVLRHVIVAGAAAIVAYIFWETRGMWDPEMRFWKAVGNSSLVLLYATLTVGALARLRLPGGWLVRYRREMGIWFGVAGAIHTFLILDGWARWDLELLLGYQFVPELGRVVRLEPGFGLANLLGLAAGLVALFLVATSTDWAVRKLGASSWKFLHQGVYIIFWLTALHVAYFLFIHYTEHFHRVPPPPDWFRYPFVALTLAVVALQAAAFVKTVRMQKSRPAPGERRPSMGSSTRLGKRRRQAQKT